MLGFFAFSSDPFTRTQTWGSLHVVALSRLGLASIMGVYQLAYVGQLI
jgi:hypothetical protein